MASRLIVATAIITTIKPAAANIHAEIEVWYAKFSNQLLIIYHAMGTAINIEMKINLKKSFDNITAMPFTDAPNTFLIPISFTFCVAACKINPYNPRHAISKDIIEEYIRIFEKRCSAKYCSPTCASTKL